MADIAQLVAGAFVMWSPGLSLVWAFAPGLDGAKFTFASLIVGISVSSATVYVLNIFLGMPFTALNAVLVSLSLAFFGFAWAVGPRLDRAWG